MKAKVNLYINGQQIDFAGDVAILYNWNLDSITNPTAVKNEYTKTIQVEGTPANNKVFGDIWDLTRTQSDNFNPSKRTPFELYLDGELYETGYCKLDTVNRNGAKIIYNITLYGGIGDFLYGLSYREDGEQLRLSDLAYIATGSTTGNPTTELDFRININSVDSAWKWLSTNGALGNKMFDVINFMPCYNGYPNDFDADKVMVNTSGFTGTTRVHTGDTTYTMTGFPTGMTSGGTTYETLNGYAYGEINGNMTEWEMRDLRSYMQRPVLRIKYLFNAICDPTQNGGYEVELDSSFFTQYNEYYENAWMTLPMLNELKYDDEISDPWAGHIGFTTNYGNTGLQYRIVDDTVRGSSTSAIEVTFRPRVYILKTKNPPTGSPLYCAAMINDKDPQWNACGFVFQVTGKDYNGNVVCGSDIYNLTSDVSGRSLNLANETLYQPMWSGGSVYNRIGYWEYEGEEQAYIPGDMVLHTLCVYRWSEDITFRVPTTGVKVENLWIDEKFVANIVGNSYGQRQTRLYSSKSIANYQDNINTWKSTVWEPSAFTGNVFYSEGSQVNSNAVVTKQTLLSLDGTPCQYLLGYLKTFGLCLRKDPVRKKIQILTRPSYYSGSTTYDIEDRIDYSKGQTITPITFNKKWYNFSYTHKDNSAVEDKYYEKYGTEYGTEKVNTGYNFDNETEDLLKGIIYNSGVDALEKSVYYSDRLVGTTENYPTFLYSWVGYKLRKHNSDEMCEFDIACPTTYTDRKFEDMGDGYDAFPKLQLHNSEKETLSGSGILVFYDGMQVVKSESGNTVSYWLTDDVGDMFYFGNNPCWLYTSSITDKSGNQIAWEYVQLPKFTRNIYYDGTIYYSWDFGKTKELYVPGVVYGENSNIYDMWWKPYINDLYDINTRVLETYVRLPKTNGERLLRRFFWFNNSLWRINKIMDWDVAGDDLTKVQFIKVQNKMNYLYYGDQEQMEKLIIEPYRLEFPATGGSEYIYLDYIGVEEFDHFSIDYDESNVFFSISGSGFRYEITCEPNTTGQERTNLIVFDYNDSGVKADIIIHQQP